MTRSPALTRVATSADVPVLVELWRELRQVGGRAERAVNPIAVNDIEDRLLEVIAGDESRVVLALVGGVPAGMAVLRSVSPDPLSDVRVVQVSNVVVDHRQRRRGIGHALLAAAADYADEAQVEHVVTGLYPSMRDASRFYARLGFAPVLVQRVAPVGVLRRRLSGEQASRIDDVVRRRSRLRRPVPAQRVTRVTRERAPERVD